MSRQVKVTATEPADQSLILRTHVVEGEPPTNYPQTSSQTWWHAHIYIRTHTRKLRIRNSLFKESTFKWLDHKSQMWQCGVGGSLVSELAYKLSTVHAGE